MRHKNNCAYIDMGEWIWDKYMKVKLTDIIDGIEMMDQYTEYFLDKETGEIEWVSDMAMTSQGKCPALKINPKLQL